MRLRSVKTIVLAAGTVALSNALSSTTQAQGLLNISGLSVLSPVFTPTGSAGTGYTAYPQEYLPVQWKVVENAPADYTYSYTVNNPAGDVQLTLPGSTLTTIPETVDTFNVSFNTTLPGAYDAGSQAGGPGTTTLNNDLSGGLTWAFNPVNPNNPSPTFSFESTLPPVFGPGEAEDHVSPSPWVSNPGELGNVALLPMPAQVPEPSTTALLGAAVFLFVALPTPARRLFCRVASARF